MGFKTWWRNENYDREHMRRFREERDGWDDLPDHVVATSMEFQLFAVGEAFRGVGKALRAEFPILDRWFPRSEQGDDR